MAYTTIDNPSEHFNTVLHTGNSTDATSITGVGFQPDWVWTKCRSNTGDNFIHDSNRGAQKNLNTNDTGTEATTSQGLQSFDSDGFTMGILGGMNFNSQTYVNWLWKANGGTTSTNTAGTNIDTTVQANTTAGFSIMTYTGTGTDNDSIGHGLGAVPHWIIVKNRDETNGWQVYHHKNTDAPETDYLNLDKTTATQDDHDRWSDQAPSSTVITLGGNDGVSKSGVKYVCYAFTEIQGYSKFRSYIGNANADGPFVYTGFRPAWLMLRNTIAGEDWLIWDVVRDKNNSNGNTMTGRLKANDSIAEVNGNDIDFLSNGFKIRTDSGYANGDGNTILYMAFAEHPFVSSKGVPVTAR